MAAQDIQQANYIELNARKNRKFGDVINWANGKFESDKNGHFRIVELKENCIKRCSDESFERNHVYAFWAVYKVRHRDEKRGYRYEWKITIREQKNRRSDDNRDSEALSSRSFLLRDNDYPMYFGQLENVETPVSQRRMEKRIFNTIYDRSEFPFNLDYRSQYPPPPLRYDHAEENLNIGEYYMNSDGERSGAPQLQIPETSKQSVQYHEYAAENSQPNSAYNNLHHHYFLNKDEVPVFKTSHFEKVQMYAPNSGVKLVPYSNAIIRQQQQPPNHDSNPPKQFNDNYRIASSSQSSIHFPDDQISTHIPLKSNAPIQLPRRGNGPYDDNRESILEGENPHDQHDSPLDGNSNAANQFLSFPSRHSSSSDIISNLHISPFPYEINTSSVTTIPAITSFLPSAQYQAHDNSHSHINQHQQYFNQFNWLRGSNPYSNHVNFVGSFPYQENTYSELDPIYHTNPPVLVTPVNILHTTNTDDATRAVSQLPLQNGVTEHTSYGPITENHQTTVFNTESTTFESITPTTISQFDDEKQSQYPDSINAQLPPPDSNTDLRVPYVEADRSTTERSDESTERSKLKYFNRNQQSSQQEKDEEKEPELPKPYPTRYKYRKNSENGDKVTQKWQPKKTRQRGSGKFKVTNDSKSENSENRETRVNRRRSPLSTKKPLDDITTNIPDYVTDVENDANQATTTTTTAPLLDDEPRTAQSVRKSVSVKVGDKVVVFPINK